MSLKYEPSSLECERMMGSSTLHPTLYALHPTPSHPHTLLQECERMNGLLDLIRKSLTDLQLGLQETLNPKPSIPKPCTLVPKSRNPEPFTLNPETKPKTPNPEPRKQ